MQILHRFSKRVDDSDLATLDLFGLVVEVVSGNLVIFEVDEANEQWPAIAAWAKQREISGTVCTKFTKQEIDAAEWLCLEPNWHYGYPQPREDEFGYLQATFDLKDNCEVCDIGKKQNAPFQMKGEPKWGRRGILQLNWVFDQFFVTPEVWATIFKPHGVKCRPVTNRKGVELKTVVQLVISEEVPAETMGLPATLCERCKRVKCLPVVRGPFPPLVGSPKAAMAWTQEYFGSGGSAWHAVLVSKELARTFSVAGVRGASLEPVQQHQHLSHR